MAITITLPYPDRHLSPNARVHWAVKAKYARMARETGFIETLQVLSGKPMYHHTNWGDEIPVSMAIYPPDKRKRDDDNVVAACKNFRDGIAKALDVDDKLFRLSKIEWKKPTKGGKVIVTIGG